MKGQSKTRGGKLRGRNRVLLVQQNSVACSSPAGTTQLSYIQQKPRALKNRRGLRSKRRTKLYVAPLVCFALLYCILLCPPQSPSGNNNFVVVPEGDSEPKGHSKTGGGTTTKGACTLPRREDKLWLSLCPGWGNYGLYPLRGYKLPLWGKTGGGK